ncbi:hypothetical protein DBZ36_14325 [Alginatibacterium sediminis]|uniref:PBP domain-containing protein n=1 Tax=Alginatibacterium sediminis TaxID=2164068 RepID=A0A420E825_9ALTE|nr:hypothetical protein [Alginatibacterium sediminis]RKF15561.1 hypothetical protein DBZ36_14325 [Alginatibacterium sediminis]
MNQLVVMIVLFLSLCSVAFSNTDQTNAELADLALASQSIYVVLNRARSQEKIDIGIANRLFSLRQLTWPDGHPVQLVCFPDSNAVHVKFSKAVLDIFPYQLRKHWDRLVYTGVATAPKQVRTDQQLIHTITHNADAIAYSNKEISDDNVYSIQILP